MAVNCGREWYNTPMKSWNEIRKAATVFSKRWKGANDAERVAYLFDLYAHPPPQGAAKRSATRGATVKEK